jgi:hypothetical protein
MTISDRAVKQARSGSTAWRNFSLLITAVAVLGMGATAYAFQDRDDGRNKDRDDNHEAYAIGLWGDLPYSDTQALTGVPNLIADMNKQDLAFVVHDGDLKAGNGTPGSVTPTTCSDALYTQALNYFRSRRRSSSRQATTIGPTAIAHPTADSHHWSVSIMNGRSSSVRRSRWDSTVFARKCSPARLAWV